jgi:hypothetical protein
MSKTVSSLIPSTRRQCLLITLATASLLSFSNRAPASEAVELTWEPSPSSHLVAYKVYVGKQSGDYTEVLTHAAVPDVVIADLEAGTTYYFAVAAVTVSGKESELSSVVSYRTPEPVTVAPPTTGILTGVHRPPITRPTSRAYQPNPPSQNSQRQLPGTSQ